MCRIKRLLSIVLSVSLLNVPVLADNYELTTSTNYEDCYISSISDNSLSDDGISDNSLSDDSISSNNIWEKLSYSGKQSTIAVGADGKGYAVAKTKINVGEGSDSSNKKVLNINKKRNT